MANDPELRTIKITGGPSTKDIRVELDGQDISAMVQAVIYKADVKTGRADVVLRVVGQLDLESLADLAVEQARS